MAQLPKEQLRTKYNGPSGRFKTNNAGLILAVDTQELVVDIIDNTPVIGITSISDLKSVTTTSLPDNILAFFRDDTSSGLQAYALVPGTDAESLPDIVRPNDHAISSKVWKLATSSVAIGRGLTFDNAGLLTLDLETTNLVTPTIVGGSQGSPGSNIADYWNVTQNNGSAYTLKNGQTNQTSALQVDRGCLVDFTGKFFYPAAGTGQSLPQNITGDFGTTDPGAGNFSATLTQNDIAVNTSFSVVLSKEAGGLIVVSGQVKFPDGVSDTTSANVSVTFRDSVYFGYSTSTSLTTTNQIKNLSVSRFGDKTETYNSVTAGAGEYTYFSYPASLGALSDVILDGASPILGAFQRQTPDVTITNDGGISVAYAVYRSNATAAFTNNTIQFS